MKKEKLKKIWLKTRNYWSNWSSLGLSFGFLFFAVSLSPSLVPRPLMLQGIASGVALTMGYALGYAIISLWRFLELPEFRKKPLLFIKLAMGAVVSGVVIYFYANTALWQNSVRELMEMEPIAGVALVRVTAIALFLWFVLVYLATGVRRLYIIVAKKVHSYVPRRVSYVVGGALLTMVLIFTINGLLITKAIDLADTTYAKIDQAIPDELTPPNRATRSGSPESLVDWNDLGREGKYFVTDGPSVEQIELVTGKRAKDPVRVYVGLAAAASLEKKAELALAELKRAGAFSRSKLVIITPTGTGWIDNGAVDAFEYLYQGDTALVGVQYSYLSSPFTLIVDPDRARDSAKAVFAVIYDYWRSLDKNTRPDLLIYGLSLGSLGSEDSTNIYTLLSDPVTGTLWAGPTFANTFWPEVVKNRNPDSPAYKPRLNGGELVRVLGASKDADAQTPDYAEWGPLRIVYLLHPSDAIVFFSVDLWYKEPAWLGKNRGADVSPYLKWYPFVTMWQIGLDMLVTTNVPYGYGHNYAPADYVRAWIELDDASYWTDEQLARINDALGTGGLNRQKN